MQAILVTLWLLVSIIVISNIASIIAGIPVVNEVAQADVKIEGYESIGDDGVLLCRTSLGSIVHLIDKDRVFQPQCVQMGGKSVRVRFRVGLELGLLTKIRMYLVGFY